MRGGPHDDGGARLVTSAQGTRLRREVAERDAAILAAAPTDPDFHDLAEYAARTPLADLD